MKLPKPVYKTKYPSENVTFSDNRNISNLDNLFQEPKPRYYKNIPWNRDITAEGKKHTS